MLPGKEYRLRCHLFGCQTDTWGVDCRRCGSFLYDSTFRQTGWMYPVYYWFWWVWDYRPYHRCVVCRRKMWFTQSSFCSPKCYDEWIPF